MNWAEIAKKYPEAEKIYAEWIKERKTRWHVRDLYDFFDEQGIVIEINVENPNTAKECFYGYIHHLFNGRTQCSTQVDQGDDRNEAEIKTFIKAFDILDFELTEELNKKGE